MIPMIKKLAGSVREYKKASIITPITVTLEVVMECLMPFVIAKLVDEIKGGCEMPVLLGYGFTLIAMALLSLLFGFIAGSNCATASCGFARNLRHDMFYRVQDYSFENIDKFSTSSLVTRMTTDVANVQMAYMMIIRIAVRCPLMLIFSLVMSFVLGGRLATVFVILVPLLGVALFAIIHKVTPIFKKVFKKYDAMNNSVQENVQGMRVVKAYVREDHEKKKFAAASDDVCADFTRAEKILALNNPIMQFCLYVTMLVVLYFGSEMIITSTGMSLSVGSLSSLLTYGFQILFSLMMVSMIFVMVTMSAESAHRVYEVLEEKPTLATPENPITEVKNGAIDFDNVSFKYALRAEKDALSHIDLHIRPGETIGILGGTGSSKSSLIQLISRLYDVSEGCVKVGGVDVRDYDLDTLRNQVAVVLQKNVLFSGTIKENLRWGNPNATDEELTEACKLAQADEFIQGFPKKYDTYIEQGGSNVSGGQKQRLCIARALLKKPKILILDDSTSAVDTRTDARIRRGFASYIPQTTKIIIAQRVSSVQDADRIVIMEDGKIAAIGTHDELLSSNPIYQEVYSSQNKAGDQDAQ